VNRTRTERSTNHSYSYSYSHKKMVRCGRAGEPDNAPPAKPKSPIMEDAYEITAEILRLMRMEQAHPFLVALPTPCKLGSISVGRATQSSTACS
jgi:hypothetical protein